VWNWQLSFLLNKLFSLVILFLHCEQNDWGSRAGLSLWISYTRFRRYSFSVREAKHLTSLLCFHFVHLAQEHINNKT
jgi:hypothetical protein